MAVAAVASSCSRAIEPLVVPGMSAVALSGGSNTSLTYAARTSAGVLLIDLGWWGQERSLIEALRSLDATAGDVAFVFLTHVHRDHLASWRSVRQARFYLATAEFPRLIGDSLPRGWIPRLAERIRPSRLPRRGELVVQTFASDTTFVIGADTMRAFLVPGHTPGSVVYLFRGTLFLGDAVTYSRFGGFSPAKRGFSDDPQAAASSLRQLWARLPTGAVRYACTAHAQCAVFTQAFIDKLSP